MRELKFNPFLTKSREQVEKVSGGVPTVAHLDLVKVEETGGSVKQLSETVKRSGWWYVVRVWEFSV